MEVGLVETFEAAKKAADAAENERCVDALKTLRNLPVSMEVLVKTQVGKRLRYLTKHPHKKIQAVASDLLNFWKNVVIEETSKDDSKNNKGSAPQSPLSVNKSESAQAVKVEKISRSGSVKGEVVSRSGSLKVETIVSNNGIKVERMSTGGTVKIERNDVSDKAMKVETIASNNGIKVERMSTSGTVKIEKNDVSDKGIKVETVKIEKNDVPDKGIKVETISKTATIKVESGSAKVGKMNGSVERVLIKQPSAPNCPPKLTSIVKCNDSARDKIREILAEAVSKVYKETSGSERDEVKNILDEVDACDPFRVAVTVESALYEKLGSSTGAHKAKYRSIIFNLKDPKNPDFRRRVLLGEVRPDRLVDMAPEDMASDERKKVNKQIKDKALFECERAGAPKATTDQFKCGRCGQRKTTYYQLQTRSADEPMTTFVTCVNCNNHWKFC